jgi:hypothetical protein
MSHHIPGATPARDRLQKVASEGRNHHPRGHQTQSPARTRPQPPPGSGARGRGRRPAARHGDRRARGRRGARGPTRNRPSTDSLPPDNPPATEPLPAPRRGQVKARLRPGEGRLSPGEGRLRGHLRRPPRPATATPSGVVLQPEPPARRRRGCGDLPGPLPRPGPRTGQGDRSPWLTSPSRSRARRSDAPTSVSTSRTCGARREATRPSRLTNGCVRMARFNFSNTSGKLSIRARDVLKKTLRPTVSHMT